MPYRAPEGRETTREKRNTNALLIQIRCMFVIFEGLRICNGIKKISCMSFREDQDVCRVSS